MDATFEVETAGANKKERVEVSNIFAHIYNAKYYYGGGWLKGEK